MAPLDRQGAEAHIAQILRERVARFTDGVEALGREMTEPISLASLAPTATPASEENFRMQGTEFLCAAVKGLSEALDQIALLDRLLEGASGCFSRACLFIVRGNVAKGWSSVGLPEGENGDPARTLSISLLDPSLLKSALDDCATVEGGDPAGSSSLLPSPAPGERLPRRAVVVPIVVRQRVSALLYGDDGGDAAEICEKSSAEILCRVASLSAERLAAEGSRETPTLARADVEIRIPPVADTAEAQPEVDLAEPDPLEEELEYASFARENRAEPSNLPPEEARLHEDARRFARLLVSELLLYNEDAVVVGRKQKDIYSRLRQEIDKSRQAYEQRVPAPVRSRVDYFQEELIRTLAQGDALALGRA